MAQLVPPHSSQQLKPLLLPETERTRGTQAGGETPENSARFTHRFRRVHAGNGRLYAARWFYGA